MARSAMFPEQPPIPCARHRNRDDPSKDVWPKRDAFPQSRAASGEAIEWRSRPSSNGRSCDRALAHIDHHARVRVDNMREQKMDRAEVLVRGAALPRINLYPD